uniref:Superoxide dismutase copper/zinc binding domain-containing protein n=1 Tax=Amphilophus citrinellus TaxID=61819 RepID=A0A3Q0SCT6_AMPCI
MDSDGKFGSFQRAGFFGSAPKEEPAFLARLPNGSSDCSLKKMCKINCFSSPFLFRCAQIYNVPEKQVRADVNMNGIKGYFSFHQASPFDVTELSVNLTNLQNKVAYYHVHNFPVRSRSSRCSNNNVGDHWNPFNINRSNPTYPKVPGSTHDMYEVGDLSGKHVTLAGRNMVDMTFKDFSLPLFGTNSIVGRSVVIHQPDGLRYACASIKADFWHRNKKMSLSS